MRGYKVSALEIEFALLHHPDVLECAVVAVPDPADASERVAAVLVLKSSGSKENSQQKPQDDSPLQAIRDWARQQLSTYKMPTRWQVLPAGQPLPRNQLGKVDKRQLQRQLLAMATQTENIAEGKP